MRTTTYQARRAAKERTLVRKAQRDAKRTQARVASNVGRMVR